MVAVGPRNLRRLLARCLERDVKMRLRDIGEARIALQPSSLQDDEGPAASPARAPRIWLPWTVAAIGMLLAASSKWVHGLLFYSTRGGNWSAWAVGVDGGNLRQVAGDAPGAYNVALSPSGDQIVFGDAPSRAVYLAPLDGGPAVELTGTRVDGKYFSPMSWSRDGARIAGTLAYGGGRAGSAGVGVYDLAVHTTTALTTDDPSTARWLGDSRRVVYFAKNGTELVVLDTVTLRRTVVDVRLPAPAAFNETFAVSPDDRTIYYGAARAEAGIWIVERSGPPDT